MIKMSNLVTVLCPKCYTVHEIENSSTTFPCAACGLIIEYEDFTCPLYISRDDHGTTVANLGFDNAIDRRELNGYQVELLPVQPKENRYWRISQQQNHLQISHGGYKRCLNDFYTSAFCLDEQFVYFDVFVEEGYQERKGVYALSLESFNSAKPVRLCDGHEMAYMISYSDYFIFYSRDCDPLEGKLLIMPKTGGWLRVLCDLQRNAKQIHVFGNWAYYVKENGNYFLIRRVSLDGKQDIVMTCVDYVSYMNVNKEGVFFNISDSIHRLGLYETKLHNNRLNFDNKIDTILQDVSSAENLCHGVLLYDEDGYIVCRNTAKVSLETGEVTTIS
jgi:hypothetical protein